MSEITVFAHWSSLNSEWIHIVSDPDTLTRFYGIDLPIYKLTFREALDGEPISAWGWRDNGSDHVVMIASTPGGFRIQFIYGPDADVERGLGTVVHLFLINYEPYVKVINAD